jgi:hypothetical protein
VFCVVGEADTSKITHEKVLKEVKKKKTVEGATHRTGLL